MAAKPKSEEYTLVLIYDGIDAQNLAESIQSTRPCLFSVVRNKEDLYKLLLKRLRQEQCYSLLVERVQKLPRRMRYKQALELINRVNKRLIRLFDAHEPTTIMEGLYGTMSLHPLDIGNPVFFKLGCVRDIDPDAAPDEDDSEEEVCGDDCGGEEHNHDDDDEKHDDDDGEESDEDLENVDLDELLENKDPDTFDYNTKIFYEKELLEFVKTILSIRKE